MEPTYSEKLYKTLFILLIISIIAAGCWLLGDVLVYVILAALVTILAAPITKACSKLHIKGHYCPTWLGAILSLIVITLLALGLMSTIIPLIKDIGRDISTANINNMAKSVSAPLAEINRWIIRIIPKLGPDFKIESVVLEKIQGLLNAGKFSSVVGSVTSFITNIGVGAFSILFIAFFFIKEPDLFKKIVLALTPDKYESITNESLDEISVLVTRYFIGITIEVLGVAFLNFTGLTLIARMGLKYSLGIAFITGILNIIPYIGPIIGYVVGISLSLIIKYACVTSYGIDTGVGAFILILLAIFVFTQFIDGVVFQPLIFSTSVKVHPLEIFLVFILAGNMGGFVGMIVAIPAYTVLRVIAKHFLTNIKAVRLLTSDGQKISETAE